MPALPTGQHRRRQSSASASRIPEFTGLGQSVRHQVDALSKPNQSEAVGTEHRSARRRTSTGSNRRISGSQGRKADNLNNEGHGPGSNRWSHSTHSSISFGPNGASQERRISHAKRYSISSTGLGSPFGTGTLATSPSRKRRSSDLLSSSPSKSFLDSLGSSISPLSFDRLPPLTLPLFTSTSTAATSPPSPERRLRNQTNIWFPSEDSVHKPDIPPSREPGSPPKQTSTKTMASPPSTDATHQATSRPRQDNTPSMPTTQPTAANPKSPEVTSPSAIQSARTSPSGQTRHRAYDSKQSIDSADSDMTAIIRPKSRREKEKKAMLSRALQRANDAVILDNNSEFLKALEAYQEACSFLEKVIHKSAAEEDKRKLAAIRSTYAERIEELRAQEFGPEALQAQFTEASNGNGTHHQQLSLANMSEEHDNTKDDYMGSAPLSRFTSAETSGAEDGLLNEMLSQVSKTKTALQIEKPSLPPPSEGVSLAPPLDFAPKPLTPKPLSPSRSPNLETQPARSHHVSNMSQTIPPKFLREHLHSRGLSNDTDVIHRFDSPVSSHSSNHSVSSIGGVHRKAFFQLGGDTEAEFDAALDAAVEAAYDDGYEPYLEHRAKPEQIVSPPAIPTDIYKNVGVKTTDREADRERVISEAKTRVAARQRMQQQAFQLSSELSDPESDGGDSEEEERLLEQVGKDFLAEHLAPTKTQSRSFPRQSDSSQSSGRTWGSSVTSSLNTLATPLSPVVEIPIVATSKASSAISLGPGPMASLPQLPSAAPAKSATSSPQQQPSRPQLTSHNSSPNLTVQKASVQDRRGSNQKAKKLKIETAPVKSDLIGASDQSSLSQGSLSPKASDGSLVPPKTAPSDINADNRPREERYSLAPLSPSKLRFVTSPFPSPLPPIHSNGSASTVAPPTPALSSAVSNDSSIKPSPQSPGYPLLRGEKAAAHKNVSNLSLKNKAHLTPTTENFDVSPGTPMSFAFHSAVTNNQRVPMNTPVAGSFGASVHRQQSKSHFLGDNLHADPMPSPYSPRSDLTADPPRALEPCPDHYLLRPFWLLRCIYQTIANPRGGYITNKVFIPRDVWKVKNVKLKGIEEKTAVCDLLTAALLKLAAVNTLDADAVLEEMQALETVLDAAQNSLSKKLGHDVGVNGISALFKDAPTPTSAATPTSATSTETGSNTLSSGSGSGSGSAHHSSGDGSNKTGSKSYLSSWRKLRTKGSSTALSSSYITAKDASKETLVMATVPMTISSAPPVRFKGPETKEPLHMDGPNAGYMSAMARLCDAAQILDQIARQVEDPGLKHSSPTHVGLELCTRHAAEFFGFYICRFALQDITMLADKFVKRASEWILS